MSMLTPDTQSLFRLIRHNEQAKGFDLSQWFYHSTKNETACGTTGCLVGNDVLGQHNGITWPIQIIVEEESSRNLSKGMRHYQHTANADVNRYTTKLSWETASGEYGYGIPHRIFAWLFHSIIVTPSGSTGGHRNNNRKEAIARVRKYLYYILHKREMMTGGTKHYEKARATGHVGITSNVLETLSA